MFRYYCQGTKDLVMNARQQHPRSAKASRGSGFHSSGAAGSNRSGDTQANGSTSSQRQTGNTPEAGPVKRLTALDALAQAAECLRTLAHPHRLRMIQMLLRGRYTVGELADACELPSHMASEHLRLMQRCGFLAAEKDGRRVYYAIAEPHLAHIMACIEARFDTPLATQTAR
jgi:DNA-binding transcriptional ArsR family regulator